MDVCRVRGRCKLKCHNTQCEKGKGERVENELKIVPLYGKSRFRIKRELVNARRSNSITLFILSKDVDYKNIPRTINGCYVIKSKKFI